MGPGREVDPSSPEERAIMAGSWRTGLGALVRWDQEEKCQGGEGQDGAGDKHQDD